MEERYSRDLRSIMRSAAEATLTGLEQVGLPGRNDASIWDSVIDAIALLVAAAMSGPVGRAFDRMARGVVDAITPNDTGIPGQIAAARDANIQLMEKAGRTYATAVRGVLERPDVWGMRVEQIRALILQQVDISVRHADLIARDQTLKLNAAITRIRQVNAGVEKYVWSTSLDERVRPTHAELEGEEFSWMEETPIGYAPGEDFMCRCVAVPILD